MTSILSLSIVIVLLTRDIVIIRGLPASNFERTDLTDVTDFYELSVNNVYVDKSLLIDELLTDNPDRIPRILRPPGWGKTTNLNMLKRFFEIEVDSNGEPLPISKRINRKLFIGGQIDPINSDNNNNTSYDIIANKRRVNKLRINDKDCTKKHLGKYPVVYVSFKEVIGSNYRQIERNMRKTVSNLFEKRIDVSRERLVNEFDRIDYDLYRNGSSTIGTVELSESLTFLCRLLSERFLRNVYVFIDDYDQPITYIFVSLLRKYYREYRDNSNNDSNNNNNNLYDDRLKQEEILTKVSQSKDLRNTVALINDILTNCFKHNGALEYGVISGVYDLELTGLNEKTITYSAFDDRYFGFYGFSQNELSYISKKRLSYRPDVERKIKRWYGYNICQTIVYDTRSIRKFFAGHGRFSYYRKLTNADDYIDICNDNNTTTTNNNNNNNNTIDTEVKTIDLADALLSIKVTQSILQHLVAYGRFSNYRRKRLRLDERLTANDYLNVLTYGGYLSGNDFGESFVNDLRLPNVQIRNQLLAKTSEWTYRNLKCNSDTFDNMVDHLINFRTGYFEEILIALLNSITESNDDRLLYYNGLLITLIDRLERKLPSTNTIDNGRYDYYGGDVMIPFKSSDGASMIVIKYKSLSTSDSLKSETNAAVSLIETLLTLDKYRYGKIRKILIVALMVKGRRYRLQLKIVDNDRSERKGGGGNRTKQPKAK